jgi:5,10-methylene-tetrahydrofolate dehydrogenase/methenyl tetrahydrofolate cyclohydrolase
MAFHFAMGSRILDKTILRVRKGFSEAGPEIPIILCENYPFIPAQRIWGARISARVKLNAFSEAGFRPILYKFQNTEPETNTLSRLSDIVENSHSGVIVQRPLPAAVSKS